VAGGGTAGHLQPALAIAEALVAAGHDRSTIEFVGSTRGQDRTTLQGRGFPFTLLPGRGIVRSIRPRALMANLGAVAGLAVAVGRGIALVGRARPRVVVSVGGYASLAASLAAVLRRVPLVLINVDAVPGAANRLLGRFARASAVGWEGSTLPRAVVTGTPVRPEIAAVERGPDGRRAARAALGLPVDRPTVVAFGGSLGAGRINRAVMDLADRWRERGDRSIYHVVGRREWDEGLRVQAPAPAGLALVRVEYQERMDQVYAAADVVVCRAGAMSVAELAVAGCPSVLVPLPGAPGDHQTANARVLERAGAAILLPDGRCDAATLATALDGLLDQPGLLESMGEAAASLGRPDAAAAGARLVEANAAPAGPAARQEAS
jgi:undecaprenyldiphospho-muramoylpentapeptide beta-N-acetylglucosaminyltransferase